jgi:hypothetical protein
MDIALYGRVIWRHKLIIGIGLIAALLLAALSLLRVGSSGVAYRDSEQWVSYETISVTQPGFTEGRLNFSGADPSRLSSLAVLYSHFIDADAVHAQIWPHRVLNESVQAAPVLSASGTSAASALPLISIAAFSSSPASAQRLAARSTAALLHYIADRQAGARVPKDQRVRLDPVQRAEANQPKLWQGRSKSLPIVIFLTVAIAALGLAFILENLDPSIKPVKETVEEESKRVGQRRSHAS